MVKYTDIVLLLVFCFLLVIDVKSFTASRWSKGHATFYGGSDASGTMGGACGYGDLYSAGYGTRTAALSTSLFNQGAACGQCYKIACDRKADRRWCKRGSVTITATNFCTPNYNSAAGWCNPPLQHFDMAQPAWEQWRSLLHNSGGIVGNTGTIQNGTESINLCSRVPCKRHGGVRFTVNGRDYFELVSIKNVGGAGSIRSVRVKGSRTGWTPMSSNWGANWQSNAYLNGQSISFMVTTTDGVTKTFPNIIPSNWRFGQTFSSRVQF